MESLLTNGNTTLYPKSYATHRCSPTRAAALSGIYPFRYGLGEFEKNQRLFDKKRYLDIFQNSFTGKHALKVISPTNYLDPKLKGSLRTCYMAHI